MTTPPYTPPPWEMEADGDGYLINGIIQVPNTYAEHHADARLIRAAPDLVRMLRDIVESDVYADAASVSPWLRRRRDDARALIASIIRESE